MARFGRNRDDNNPNTPESDEHDVFADDANEIAEEMVNEETPAETVNEDNVSEENAEVENTETVNEETATPVARDPRVQFEDIPGTVTHWEGIPDAAAPIAYALTQQVIGFRNSYMDAVETLSAASFDGSEENVIELADKYKDRDHLIPSYLEVFKSAQKAYQDALKQLTDQVKDAANIKKLSETERAEYVTLAKNRAASVTKAINSMEEFAAINPSGDFSPAIDWIKDLPDLPGIPGTKGSAAKAVKLGTSVSRPRLGPGGYIKITDKANVTRTESGFSKALPALSKLLDRTVMAPELHKAWQDAANVSSWSEVPVDTEITFDFFGLTVTVMRKAETT